MTFLDSLPRHARALIEENLETRSFPEGTCILQQGTLGDGCYWIDQGRVRIEFDTGEVDTEVVLRYLEPGAVMGEIALVDNGVRSANAYAHTDVVARWLSSTKFQGLCKREPEIGVALLTAFCQNLTPMIRQMTEQLADYSPSDKLAPMVDEMVGRSHAAQRDFQDWDEERVDRLLQDIAATVAENADELAAQCVRETGLGVVADKACKIRFAGLHVYGQLAGRHASGWTTGDGTKGVTEFMSPMGVIFGLVPVTNPVSTIVFKTLICLKARNSLVLSCHHNALGVGTRTGDIIHSVLLRHGAPVYLLDWVRERTSRKLTDMFMRHRDVSLILATGGPSMVKAAYSSGTPAIGVGSGNAPVLVCRDADPADVARIVVESKSFDNGIICGSENNLVADIEVRDSLISALREADAAVLTPSEVDSFTACVFDPETHHPRRSMIGQSASYISQAAGIQRDFSIRLIVVPVASQEIRGPYGREKLAPILSLFTAENDAHGLALCRQILQIEGMGHTAIVHTKSVDLARRFARDMPVSRVLVNAPGSQGCIGLGTALTPSLTLGCGTWGNTSTTDNVSYGNLLNIKRMALGL